MVTRLSSASSYSSSAAASSSSRRLYTHRSSFARSTFRPRNNSTTTAAALCYCWWLSSSPSSLLATAFPTSSSSSLALRPFLQFSPSSRRFESFPALGSRRAMTSSTTATTTEDPATDDTNNNNNNNNLRVGLCQFVVTPNRRVNHETCRSFVQQAVAQGAQLVVLPEIWASPYATAAFGDYAQILPDVVDSNNNNSNDDDTTTELPQDSSARLLQQLAQEHQIWLIGGSLAERVVSNDDNNNDDLLYNTCLVYNPAGRLVAKHRKVHLFDVNVPGGIRFQESETLTAGNLGATHFTTPWGNVGIGICYDIRFATYAALLRHRYNCFLLVFPGAFNMTTGPLHWELLQRARALDQQCYVLTASPARLTPEEAHANAVQPDVTTQTYPHYTAWGHSSAVSPWGHVLATTEHQPAVVVADLDLSEITKIRAAIPIATQERHDLYQVVEREASDI